ncbi:MAG: Asp-tRNA(Asn)/Glu-tRNA(Gln) amidotransferase subunit GatB [Bacteroidetes bacterium]|nr:Asp-tRNA(Asn)/Glu-tRNA(Gln) amidotransferase subunit GatB [Bacteroidota bacterium]
MKCEKEPYEAVIGLEIHARLATNTKLFCGDYNRFGDTPNSLISEISLAHPGTLPFLNKKAVSFAVKMGIACHCDITDTTYFARKNYFYPDLPKGYQVTQHISPICKNGYVPIRIENEIKDIFLNRIHLEEDAGKSLHDLDDKFSCLDFNRAGTPLIEIVTEPVLHSAEEAYQFLSEIRRLVKWLDICDGNMEEGSLRCDANISIRPKGSKKLGVKVEVKNLNSLRFVKKAIQVEINRLIELAKKNQQIIQETRSYDATSNTTFPMRDKESADDYRYFPEPDLPPVKINEGFFSDLKKSMPELPSQKEKRYCNEYKLPLLDAERLCAEKQVACYFDEAVKYSTNYKALANLITGPLMQYLHEQKSDFSNPVLPANKLEEIVQLIDENKINFSIAASKLLPFLMTHQNEDVLVAATREGWLQINDTDELEKWIQMVLDRMPDKVKQYQQGKKGLIGLMMGEVKKISKGKADPVITIKLLEEKLTKSN